MRFDNQKGVSLLLLVIAITVFAGIAIGIVTLLRTRYESYPYQVQSYQAYALANAGVEFAIRYAKENNTDPAASDSFTNSPATYISIYPSYKDFSFGNGTFSLSYQPGCPDRLYSKGTYGTATREVSVSNFGSYLGSQGASVYMVNAQVSRTCYGAGCAGRTCWNGATSYTCPADPYPGPPQYFGDRIQISYCVPNMSAAGHTTYIQWVSWAPSGVVTATQPVTLGRLGFTDNVQTLQYYDPNGNPKPGHPLTAWWVWDATCGITDGTAATPPWCPGAYTQGLNSCPAATGPYAGMVDCVTTNDGAWPVSHPNGHYNFPTVQGWDGTSDPPNTGYPYFWNTDQTTSASTELDATCRPVVPCDPALDIAANSDCASCGSYEDCISKGCPCMAESACFWSDRGCSYTTWPPFLPWNPAGTVMFQGHYPCFDATPSCNMNTYGPIARSRQTCHFPLGCGDPHGCPAPLRSIQASVNLNRITIETIGHVDAVAPFKMYVSFYTYVANTGNIAPIQPAVKNVFTFTVR